MIFQNLFLFFVLHIVHSEKYRDRAKIFLENGDLYFTSPGNIKFSTNSDVVVNNFNLLSTLDKAYNASKFIEGYQKVFSIYIDRIEALEEKSFDNISKTNSSLPVEFVHASIRRINRRFLALQRRIGTLQRLLTINECLSNPCKNGGVCQDIFNGYLCTCIDGWEGPNCETDVNECSRFSGTDLGCQNGASCVNKPGTYECLCPQGWFGIHCSRRSTDCTVGSSELCGHGTCIPANNNLGYKCLCDGGWTSDGNNLACNVDVDECKQNHPPCSTNPKVTCLNVPGSYFCGPCPQGYTGNGFYCTDVDECNIFNGGCSAYPMVQCINTPGSRTCGPCPPGYSGDGVTCSFVGICQVNNGGCHYLAQCRDNPRISSTYVECICPARYVGNGIGPNGCLPPSQDYNPCSSNPCVNGVCVVNNSSRDYVCNCRRKYTGRNCDIFKDPCASNPCQNGGTCQTVAGITFTCQCLAGFTGRKCQLEREVCGGFLSNENGTLQYPPPNSVSIRNQPMSCAWIIKVDTSKVLNITFESFEAGTGHDTTNCRAEFIQIYDGGNTVSKLLGRFCGKQLPLGGNFLTSQHLFYIWAKGTINGNVKFKLNWTSVEPYCGGTIDENTPHGKIESPGTPGNYPNNRDCYWNFAAPEGKRYLFHFYSLDIGENPSCQHDFLEFSDMQQTISKICNSTLPNPLYSPGRYVTVHFHSDDKDTYRGFQITYSVVEGIPGCGGTFTNNEGIIQSPTNIGENQANVECEYRIKSPAQSRIKLTFLELKTECPNGVNVYEGPSESSPLIGRYCGENLAGPYVSNSKEILILAKANVGSWKIEYKRECHQIYTEVNSTITILSQISCTVEIQQPEGYIITLDMTYEITSGSIKIYDGDNENAPILGKYGSADTTGKAQLMSTYNHLLIKTNYAVWKRLEISYTSTNVGCGGILNKHIGSIKSPTHPSGYYPSDQLCRWIIKAPPGYVIQLTWLMFNLEESFSCSYDNVQVFDNNTDPGMGGLLGTFCGYTLPPSILSSSNIMTVTFATDESIQTNGFSATYIFLQERDVCGGNYFTSAGVLRSPGYPVEYPTNRICAWTITVPQGQQIVLNVTSFDIENYPNCRFDFVEIRNGGTSASPLIGRYCGTSIPKEIPSHTNKMFILFQSDISKNGKGFEIYWSSTSTGCGGILTSPMGTIISPNYPEPYGRETECIWRITVNTGSKIQAIFGDIDLEDHQTCILDYVEIFDGTTKNSKSLGRYCTGQQNNPLVSSKNSLLVRFKSDISEQGRGFQLIYSTVCRNTLRGFRGVIESPNFPNPYPNNQKCQWNIIVPSKNKINITFSHFDIERTSMLLSNTSCMFDYVEIKYYDTSEDTEDNTFTKSLGRYCGNKSPGMMTINSSHAEITFYSDNLLLGNGFRLEWQLFGCGGLLTQDVGTIQSPNYPKSYPDNIECDWQIEVDVGYSIQINFTDINLESDNTCNYDYIEVFNNVNSSNNSLAKLCYQHSPTVLTSNSNKMFVQFITDISHRGIGFKANYITILSKCGGKITSSLGTISSPNYPEIYDKNDNCEWEIEVKDSHSIEVEFSSMHIKPSTNCTDSFVKIFDGPSEAYPVLLETCGLEKPNGTIKSSYNHIYIKFKGSAFPTKGFSLKYKEACGSRISTQGSGIIEVFNGRHMYDFDFYYCSWIISALDPTQHVSLTITYMNDYHNLMDENHVRIYDGEFDDSPIIGNYSGTKLPPTLYSDGSVMKISLIGRVDFRATYSVLSSQCGGTLTSIDGFFSSPHYPRQYPSETQCEWTLPVSPGNHITLSFINFDIPESENCNDDFLEIRQSNSSGKLVGAYCGQKLPPRITEQNSLWILFQSSKIDTDVSTTSKGFYAEYSLDSSNSLTGPQGTISSPLYPEAVSYSLTMFWKITVSPKKKILLTFKDFYFDLSYYENTCYDPSLEVFDGVDSTANSLGSFCGTSIPQPIKSSSNIIFIKADLSDSRTGSKFLLEWLEVDEEAKRLTPIYNTVPGCGSAEVINLHPPSIYELKSPGYPEGYAPRLKCEWIFSTIPINHIQIVFYDVNFVATPLFGTRVCTQDYVELYTKDETSDNNWNQIQKVCKSDQQYLPFYGTNLLKVVLKTNSVYNGTGFAAKLGSVCGGTLDLSRDKIGRISSENSTYAMMSECQWNITARSGRTIKMKFEQLDLNKDGTCSSYIMVRNGKFPDSPILGKGKYCNYEPSLNVSSSGKYIYMKYSGVTAKGNFSIRFEEESQFCGGEIHLSMSENSTEISSPNYPNIPLPHSECIWLIAAPPGESLQIDFEGFDLPNCSLEYVELRDGATEASPMINNRFCRDMPSSQYTTDNMLYVKFFTDIDDPSTGFKAKVKIQTCGGTLRGSSGDLKTPVLKDGKSQNCTWHIIAPMGHYLTIKFTKFNIGTAIASSTFSHTLYVSEINEINQNQTLLAKLRGNKLPSDIKTSSSEAVIVYEHNAQFHFHTDGFALMFRASLEKCGVYITQSQGYITSPGYPVMNSNARSCQWMIEVPKGRRVTFKLLDFDLDPKPGYTGLILFDGFHYRLGIVHLKSKDIGKTFESSDNKMTVFLGYYLPSAHRGFKAEFSSNNPTACAGDFNQTSGILEQPVIQSYMCLWVHSSYHINETLAMSITLKMNKKRNSTPNCKYASSSIMITNHEDNKGILDILCKSTDSPLMVRSAYPITKIQAISSGFGTINFTISYSTHPCGGIITSQAGYISSPNFPNKPGTNVECAWLLELDENQRIKVNMQNITISKDCKKSFVSIYNGKMPSDPRIHRYCENDLLLAPSEIISQSNHMLIEYKYQTDSSATGFNFTYEAIDSTCGGIFHERSRIIQTPSYGKEYPNNAECLWEIRSNNGYYIQLKFLDRFYIAQSKDCKEDYMEIFDWREDKWVSMGKKCGRNAPEGIKSTGGKMRILFRSNEKTTGAGFKAMWEWHCGGTFEAVEQTRYIVSPGYPDGYEGSLTCIYNITSPNNIVNIEFEDFELESVAIPGCKFDNLTIESKMHSIYSRQQSVYCGNDMPPPQRVRDYIVITFMADKHLNRKGFKFSYKDDMCGGEIRSQKTIEQKSLNRSLITHLSIRPYMQRKICTWKIKAPTDQIAVLDIQHLNMDAYQNCFLQRLEIYRSWNTSYYNRLASLCGILEDEPTIHSDTNEMVVTLDVNLPRFTYFSAQVSFAYGPSSGCGGRINLTTTTTIQSPNHLLDSKAAVDCIWQIRAPRDFQIKIEMPYLISRTCELCWTLEIRDGASPLSEKISALESNISNKFSPIMTSSNTAYFRFIANLSSNIEVNTPGKIFVATITPIISICGHSIMNVTEKEKMLESPSYPNPYPPDIKCNWVFYAPRNQRLVLHFEDFDVGTSVNGSRTCDNDQLQVIEDPNQEIITQGLGPRAIFASSDNSQMIYKSYRNIHTFCGNKQPFDYYAEGKSVTVLLKSTDGIKNSKGFKLGYSIAGCNRNYTSLQGRILQENTKGPGCYLIIEVPKNRTISLFFNYLFFGFSQNCTKTGFEIRDGGPTGTQMIKSCGISSLMPLFSTTNKVWIHAWYDSLYWSKYDITYTSTDMGQGCGGPLYNYKGKFSSPLYPNAFRNNTMCTWYIEVPSGRTFQIMFQDFDIRGPCDKAYVEVDTFTNNAKSTHKFCSQDTPAALDSQNEAVVRFQSFVSNGGSGFQATFGTIADKNKNMNKV